MKKLVLFLLCLAVWGAILAVGYGWLQSRPELVSGVFVAGLCLANLAGVVIGAFWTYYAVRAGAQVATYTNASQAGATTASVNLAKEIVRQFGGANPSPSQVKDAPSSPLPSQTRQVRGWLPPLEGFETASGWEVRRPEEWQNGRAEEER
jgi:hypothetical protein